MTKQELTTVPNSYLWGEWGKLDGLTAYNIWLKDYLLKGGEIHQYYDTNLPASKVIPVDNPDTHAPSDPDSLWGGSAPIYILSPEFDVNGYDHRFVSRYSHASLYGWTHNGQKPVHHSPDGVCVYTNTADKDMLTDHNIPWGVSNRLRVLLARHAEQW